MRPIPHTFHWIRIFGDSKKIFNPPLGIDRHTILPRNGGYDSASSLWFAPQRVSFFVLTLLICRPFFPPLCVMHSRRSHEYGKEVHTNVFGNNIELLQSSGDKDYIQPLFGKLQQENKSFSLLLTIRIPRGVLSFSNRFMYSSGLESDFPC